ncbi:hypothetical protein A6R68_09384, partial [Neotoma lepida]
ERRCTQRMKVLPQLAGGSGCNNRASQTQGVKGLELNCARKQPQCEGQSQRASWVLKEMFAKDWPLVHYNTTQFLMNNHSGLEEPNLYVFQQLQGCPSRQPCQQHLQEEEKEEDRSLLVQCLQEFCLCLFHLLCRRAAVASPVPATLPASL